LYVGQTALSLVLMGFLTKTPIERIWLDDAHEWWVDVRMSLSVDESEQAQEALLVTRYEETKDRRGATTTVMRPEMKPLTHLRELVVASVVEWNLTDEDDELLPFQHDYEMEKKTGKPSPLRVSVTRLPQSAFDVISEVVLAANHPMSREETASFPDGVSGSAPNGDDQASDDQEVLRGASLVVEDGDANRLTTVAGAPGA
jgi:hypothetical protein